MVNGISRGSGAMSTIAALPSELLTTLSSTKNAPIVASEHIDGLVQNNDEVILEGSLFQFA
jgi:hypothetical protein